MKKEGMSHNMKDFTQASLQAFKEADSRSNTDRDYLNS